jgi:hypothetical protein
LLDRAELYFLTSRVSNPRRNPRYLLSAIESLVVHRQQQQQQLCPSPVSAMGAVRNTLIAVLCISFTVFVALFGRLPIFRYMGASPFLCFVSLTRPEA